MFEMGVEDPYANDGPNSTWVEPRSSVVKETRVEVAVLVAVMEEMARAAGP
jgi:hypothetical protein